LLISCSTTQNLEIKNSHDDDILSSESFSRMSISALSKIDLIIPDEQNIIDCKSGKSDQTLKKLAKNTWKNENNFYYWSSVALCFFKQNEIQKSLFYYSFAKPSNDLERSIYNNNLAVIYYSQEKYHQVYNYLKLSIQKSKLNTPRYNLIKFMINFNMYANVIDEISSIRGYQSDSFLNYLLALSYYKTKRFTEIIKLQTKDHEADLMVLKSLSQLALGKTDLASKELASLSKSSLTYNKQIYDELNKYLKQVNKK
jgi:tetratricopeptide (TPR) repeat protein